MPRFDFRCAHCGEVRECYVMSSTGPNSFPPPKCSKCKTEMEKLPAAPNFNVQGFSAKNGYSK